MATKGDGSRSDPMDLQEETTPRSSSGRGILRTRGGWSRDGEGPLSGGTATSLKRQRVDREDVSESPSTSAPTRPPSGRPKRYVVLLCEVNQEGFDDLIKMQPTVDRFGEQEQLAWIRVKKHWLRVLDVEEHDEEEEGTDEEEEKDSVY